MECIPILYLVQANRTFNPEKANQIPLGCTTLCEPYQSRGPSLAEHDSDQPLENCFQI